MPALNPFISLAAGLVLVGAAGSLVACNGGGDGPADTMETGTGTAETSSTTLSGDGDGDPTGDGDGDGDPTGDGDGEPGCTDPGCPCTDDGDCGDGLVCAEGMCKETSCGDLVVEGDEECEDGNAIDGDGCDNDCTFTRVNRVETGLHHSCAIIDGGGIVCWGRGDVGQLGYGEAQNVGDDEFPSDVGPVPLPGPVVKLDLGGAHTCAVFDDGALRCWGGNERGQLGYGNLDNFGDDEPLDSLPAISVPTAIDVEASDRHTCARVGNGEVRCWGANDLGQLGYANTFTPVLEMPSPGGALSIGSAVSALAGGFNHDCTRLIDGAVRCWGRNDLGQLGYGNVVNIGDDEQPSAAGPLALIPAALPDNTEVVSIALGGNHGCAVLGGGELMCWGDNSSGQLGYGDLNNIGDDETPSMRAPVELGGPVAEVVCGGNHTCARVQGGDIYCWGDNTVGQLGLGHVDNVGDDELPLTAGAVQIGGTVVQMSAGGNHTCVLTSEAEVRCWGQNNFSQLGLGSSVTVGDNETPSDVDPVSVM